MYYMPKECNRIQKHPGYLWCINIDTFNSIWQSAQICALFRARQLTGPSIRSKFDSHTDGFKLA